MTGFGSKFELNNLKGKLVDSEFQGNISGESDVEKYNYAGSLVLNTLDFQSITNLILEMRLGDN